MLVVVKKSARADNLIYFGQCLVSLLSVKYSKFSCPNAFTPVVLSGHNTDGFFLREWRYRNDKK
ncbi:Uncharacterized [Syntrophomonas zehnderi OL-4]|uniref:Uncharacterized n=1 Tax=Syntrophomonas zehnderi OL-4 TaxID=690567 RepID=A0A0E4C7J7_9FIRM|nr:hypothetical protein [Syntrophomonas zehnderi]CFX01055.1 Uncharacterized [Syntrophomonas zehnderi OL-4]